MVTNQSTMAARRGHNRYTRILSVAVVSFVLLLCNLAVEAQRRGFRHGSRGSFNPRRLLALPPPPSSSKSPPSINPGDTLFKFLADVQRLDELAASSAAAAAESSSDDAKTYDNNNYIPILSKTHSKRDSSYTKSWTSEDWEQHQVKSLQRYTRHIKSWPFSPTFHAVIPTLAVTFCYTLFCILLVSNNSFVRDFVDQSRISTSTSTFSSPIGILLALKTNRALNRLNESRNYWGKIIRVCTSLAGMIVNYVSPIDEEKGLLMGRYLCCFGWTLKGIFRGNEDDTVVLRTLLPESEASWLINCDHDHPSAIIFRLRNILAGISQEGNLMSATALGVMEDRLEELEQAMGVLKRIVASPIPPTFTRMTSRTLVLFLFFLPLSLIGNGTNPVSILVIGTLLSYIFVCIDEISVEVEHPFPLLPMFTLSKMIERNVRDQFVFMKDLTEQQQDNDQGSSRI